MLTIDPQLLHPSLNQKSASFLECGHKFVPTSPDYAENGVAQACVRMVKQHEALLLVMHHESNLQATCKQAAIG